MALCCPSHQTLLGGCHLTKTTQLDFLGTVWLVLHCLWLHHRLPAVYLTFPVALLLGWHAVIYATKGSSTALHPGWWRLDKSSDLIFFLVSFFCHEMFRKVFLLSSASVGWVVKFILCFSLLGICGWFHTRGTWDDLFFPWLKGVGFLCHGIFPECSGCTLGST